MLQRRLPISLLLAMPLLLAPRFAAAAEADTQGTFQALFVVQNANVNTSSMGTSCVHVNAGSQTNPGSGTSCTIAAPAGVSGKGHDAPKFLVAGPGQLSGDADGFSNVANTTVSGATIASTSSALWNSFHSQQGADVYFGAWHDSSARVTNSDPQLATSGRAVADSRDPLDFSAPSSGTFSYEVVLAGSFKADNAGARNALAIRASIEGVSVAGQPLNGPLWSLDITTNGVVTSSASFNINLWTAPVIGVTPAQKAAAENHLRQEIQPGAGGSVGFPDDVPLFGSGGPLPAIALQHPAGTSVRYSDSLSADSRLVKPAAVPAGSPWASVVLALLLLAVTWRVRAPGSRAPR